MEDYRLSDIKKRCYEVQENDGDCCSCELFVFCNGTMSERMPMDWEIGEKDGEDNGTDK